MKDKFTFHLPTRIYFGRGEIHRLNRLIPEPIHRILIVTDPGILENTSHISQISAMLDTREVDIFYDIEENPTIMSVKKGSAFAEKSNSEFILGVGGGSTMDVAKGVANRVENPIPVACIPTTSGTGSEATPYAVFTDPDQETKIGYSSESYFPLFSIVDPELTYSMPEKVILNTGLDALAHAIEAYFSMDCSELSDQLALHSIDLVIRNLQKAIQKDRYAMDKMAYAAAVSGMAIAHTSTILPHIMGYPLTVYHHVPHGRASMLLIPAYLDYLKSNGLWENKRNALSEKFKDTNGLRGFLKILEVPLNLADYGVEEQSLNHYVAQTMTKNDVQITPGSIHENSVKKIYLNSM
jgi:alcohol dehydrogenase